MDNESDTAHRCLELTLDRSYIHPFLPLILIHIHRRNRKRNATENLIGISASWFATCEYRFNHQLPCLVRFCPDLQRNMPSGAMLTASNEHVDHAFGKMLSVFNDDLC
jgi:hypothetical protein